MLKITVGANPSQVSRCRLLYYYVSPAKEIAVGRWESQSWAISSVIRDDVRL